MTEHALCPMTHKTPPRLYPPLTVCTWHADRAEQAVSELPSLYDALGERLAAGGGSALTGMPHSDPDPGISLDHRKVACRTNIRNNLAAWARTAVIERGFTPPLETVPAMAVFITVQIDWYTSQPSARQFCSDVIDDWHTARALNDPNKIRSFAVGPCPEPDCEGTLIARIRPADDLLPHDVTCDCSPEDEDGNLTHIWPADKWMLLGRRVVKKAQA